MFNRLQRDLLTVFIVILFSSFVEDWIETLGRVWRMLFLSIVVIGYIPTTNTLAEIRFVLGILTGYSTNAACLVAELFQIFNIWNHLVYWTEQTWQFWRFKSVASSGYKDYRRRGASMFANVNLSSRSHFNICFECIKLLHWSYRHFSSTEKSKTQPIFVVRRSLFTRSGHVYCVLQKYSK